MNPCQHENSIPLSYFREARAQRGKGPPRSFLQPLPQGGAREPISNHALTVTEDQFSHPFDSTSQCV